MTPSPSADSSALVTVVILGYTDGKELLLPCLRHVLAQRGLPPDAVDVWVVHNPPGDDLPAEQRRTDDWPAVFEELQGHEFRGVRVTVNDRNLGYAGGTNVALRAVRTPFVAIVNNDARPRPTCLAELLAAFDGDQGRRLGAATAKVVFLPRFLPVGLSTPGFVPAEVEPGNPDTRSLGVRVYDVSVNGRDVTEEVFWGRIGYEREAGFRWTRPTGSMLMPVDPDGSGPGPAGPLRLRLKLAADTIKPVELRWPGGEETVKAGVDPVEVELLVPAGARLVDQLNSAGNVVDADGYGSDRGFQEVDRGQYDRPEEVFGFSGAAVCFRTAALRDASCFDDDFFLYYEDTDLAWRLRARGWQVRYVPSAVVRHRHSATTREWSPPWWFWVDRNRLLTLTKNARASLAARQVLAYLAGTAWLALCAAARVERGRRRVLRTAPSVWVRLRVVGSYLRLLPRMLRRRRALARRALVGRADLERWLARRPPEPDH
jgi:GT2 family glycosyltransferase